MRSIAVLRVTIEPLEDACLVRATGELDSSTADRLRSPLNAARADGVTTLLDVAGITFIDSAGLRVLLEAARASDLEEWPWFVVRPSPAVLRVVALSDAAARLPLVVAQDGAPPRERPPAVRPQRVSNTRARRAVHR